MQDLIRQREEAMQQLTEMQKRTAENQAELQARKILINQIFDLDMQIEELQRGDRL